MDITLLGPADVEDFVAHVAEHLERNGRFGELVFAPYGSDDTPSSDTLRSRNWEEQWATPVGATRWSRVWVARRDGLITGHCDLVGGEVPGAAHRARLGLGVHHDHRRQGIGRALSVAVITWAQSEPTLDWLDLGVFAHNLGAKALYESLGFTNVGRTADRFRVDGQIIDDIQMTRWVGDP